MFYLLHIVFVLLFSYPLRLSFSRCRYWIGHLSIAVAFCIFYRRIIWIMWTCKAYEQVPRKIIRDVFNPFTSSFSDIGVLKIFCRQYRIIG
ncbi:hypothetical protein D3C76_1728650 [compost metagenome]